MQTFDDATVNVSSNAFFREEFGLNVTRILAILELRVGEANERDHRESYVGLISTIMICPAEFLASSCPQMTKTLDRRLLDFDVVQKDYLARLDGAITQDVQNIYLAVCGWMARMENLYQEMKLQDLLQYQSTMLIKGVLFVFQISHYLKTFMSMHINLGVPMNRSHVKAVFRLVLQGPSATLTSYPYLP